MAKKIVISKGLTFGCLFKLFFLGLLFSAGIMIVAAGCFSLFGFHILYWNHHPVVGFDGFLIALATAPLFAALYGFVLTLFIALGLWIYTRVFSLRITAKLRHGFGED